MTIRTLSWALAVCFTIATPATAQTIARSFVELHKVVEPGKKVAVFDSDGNTTTGKIISISGASLELELSAGQGAPNRLIIPEYRVREIRRTDSRWNGALIGFGVGYFVSWMLCRNDGECNRSDITSVQPRDARPISAMHVTGPLILASLVAGPVLGGYIDGKFGNRTIYLAPSRTGEASWRVSPVVTPRRAGVFVSFRF